MVILAAHYIYHLYEKPAFTVYWVKLALTEVVHIWSTSNPEVYLSTGVYSLL